MGNLLISPVTEKETHSGITQDDMPFAVSSMQGWRVHMEDAHIAEAHLYALDTQETNKEGDPPPAAQDPDQGGTKIYLPNHAVFAVFDGHGGTYAAKYSGANFLRVLSGQPKWLEYAKLVTSSSASSTNDKNNTNLLLEQALKQAFVELDKEIANAIQGKLHPLANTPYHPTPPPTKSSSSATDADGSEEKDEGGMQVENSRAAPAAAGAAGDGHDPIMAAATQHASALDDEGDSGTTACLVLLTPDSLVCANAGDSRAVFARKSTPAATEDGEEKTNDNEMTAATALAVPLSFDHKPDDEAEEKRIRAAGGYVAGGRVEGDLAVSRGLGDFRFKHLPTVMRGVIAQEDNTSTTMMEEDNDGQQQEQSKNDNTTATTTSTTTSSNDDMYMNPGDQKVSPIPDIVIHQRNTEKDLFAIVACDGIWDVRSNQECVVDVATLFDEGESNVGLICEEVLDMCLRFGSKDNMTALVVQFPAQKVNTNIDGIVTGVMARRKDRDDQMKAEQGGGGEQQQQQEEGDENNSTSAESSSSSSDGDNDTATTDSTTSTESSSSETATEDRTTTTPTDTELL